MVLKLLLGCRCEGVAYRHRGRDGPRAGTGSSLVLVVWAVAPPLQTGGWVCDLKSLSCCAAGLRVGVRYRSGGDPGA
jgi:hypothetical protein